MNLAVIPGMKSGLSLAATERVAVIYMAIPLAIFFLGWFRPAPGIVLAIILIVAIKRSCRALPSAEPIVIPWRNLLLLAAIAALWAAFGGAGHFLFANSDWRIRDAVLRDLVLGDWPVAYAYLDSVPVILRTPLAYFLPAATFGKLAGIRNADLFLYAWTALGAWLFLALTLARTSTRTSLLAGAAILIFFSGMDLIGMIGRHGPEAFDFSTHLEWWATRFQYSSATTLLFWVPNHAFSGWLVAAILLNRWRTPNIVPTLPLLAALMVLWSPLPLIGVAPFMAAIVVFHAWHRRLPVDDLLRSGSIAAIVFLPVALYVTSDLHGIPTRWASTAAEPALQPGANAQFEFARLYAMFVFLEFGALAFVLMRLSGEPMARIASIILLALPLYSLGPNNDLAMRASIPALAILAMVSVDCIVLSDWKTLRTERTLLVILLIIGSATAASEFSRTLRYAGRPLPTYQKSMVQVAASFPPHYVARLSSPMLAWVLKPPSLVPQAGTVPDDAGPRQQARP